MPKSPEPENAERSAPRPPNACGHIPHRRTRVEYARQPLAERRRAAVLTCQTKLRPRTFLPKVLQGNSWRMFRRVLRLWRNSRPERERRRGARPGCPAAIGGGRRGESGAEAAGPVGR